MKVSETRSEPQGDAAPNEAKPYSGGATAASRKQLKQAVKRLRRALGFFGIALALPFFFWVPLGWLETVPSMVDVYGMEGLRTPASLAVGGLLIAALGFYEP